MNSKIISAALRLCGFIVIFSFAAIAQKIPEPKDVLGFTPGDDRKLASWAKIVEYFQKLDAASGRVVFKEIGKSTKGKPFTYALISTPENLANIDRFKEINDKLADPRKIGRDDRKAAELIAKGKTFVLITCGVHSTEVGSTLSSMLIAHKLASSNEQEIKGILENTIIILVPSLNPDGVDIVKNWYDTTLGTEFERKEPPELYHKYVGHDSNRDWYAFTQVETQLTVDHVHNVYHPQIVHDIHQQGTSGSRLFLPPYEPPVEPNVPKEIIQGYTELGLYMAREMRDKGFEGITTGTTYDAWTPARAYSHYHGGVRILSETASANLATPIEIKFDDLRGRRGFDAKKESGNFGPVWNGGKWTLGDITSYMTNGAFSLLKHAADNRKKWLTRFYAIGREATRPRGKGDVEAYVLDYENGSNAYLLGEVLKRGGVEKEYVGKFEYDGRTYRNGTSIIRLDQPYGGFAKALIEPMIYPNLLDEKGQPIPPYDVTAHNLPLLYGAKLIPIKAPFDFPKILVGQGSGSGSGSGIGQCSGEFLYGAYKSHIPSMDEGWTRWVFENRTYDLRENLPGYCSIEQRSVLNKDITEKVPGEFNTIVFPDQSPDQILNGFAKDSMPNEYVGGLGKEGVANLKKFVDDGGTLVFLNRASDFAIREFGLPLRDATAGLDRKNLYIPGSILRTELDVNHPIAKNMLKESIAWFEESPAFEITDNAKNVEIIASYPKKTEDILLSGWALGAEKLAGKAALVSVKIGKGKIILFGFRPQYRGQSLATYQLLFNAITIGAERLERD